MNLVIPLGLIHCHVPTCVMRSSTYVEDIDQKSVSSLCVIAGAVWLLFISLIIVG